ncbi:hypothetical protein HUE87_07670 [Candidatus Sulfurimonas marisnigri]|uniref:HPt domain-containing protein n=1 Tax=Candidatus Sulfurimonas marisnigri TaxID=2740405 RepID=A0A7S7LZK3_9BACT|nr:hypothetical protein [Candidatus Sulfurimonas marisnigri]QOY53778.1 hypothetical protein HUE87_07670 [Candidatus Sulfurimonas marisnigri]
MEKRLNQNIELRRSIQKLISDGSLFLEKYFKEFDISNYNYSVNEAVIELGLDEETVDILIEDYILQILKSKITFYKYIQELKKDGFENKTLDYTNLRNLAHKNFGVARNLRIKDSAKILEDLMVKDDLDYLRTCVKALEITAVKLNPLCAYEALKLIEVKNTL